MQSQEYKVDCIDFKPIGLKLFTKQRIPGDAIKGGGLAIGFIENEKIMMEEVNTNSRDIMILDGTIFNEKVRIILVYFNCSKELEGRNCRANSEIQREVEQYIQVENDKHLICLGDMNGRLQTLEPRIRTDKKVR